MLKTSKNQLLLQGGKVNEVETETTQKPTEKVKSEEAWKFDHAEYLIAASWMSIEEFQEA